MVHFQKRRKNSNFRHILEQNFVMIYKSFGIFTRIIKAPKIALISFPTNLNMCLGAQKNRIIETVLLSTHNICFG